MKRFILLLAAATTLAMAGCHDEETREDAPLWKRSDITVNDPLWRQTDSTLDITSTMNIIAAIEGMQPSDQLAAFCDGVCVGLSTPVPTKYGLRFYLCIFQPTEATHPITLAYYNASEQRVYYWHDIIVYTNDAVIGQASNPYLLNCSEAGYGMYSANLTYTLSAPAVSDRDELALFCGDECRQILRVTQKTASVRIDLHAESEELYVRYYSDALGKIFTSKSFSVKANDSQTIDLDF